MGRMKFHSWKTMRTRNGTRDDDAEELEDEPHVVRDHGKMLGPFHLITTCWIMLYGYGYRSFFPPLHTHPFNSGPRTIGNQICTCSATTRSRLSSWSS